MAKAQIVAHLAQPELHRHRIADADNRCGVLLVLGADVDPHVLELHHLLALFIGEQMDRLAGDDRRHWSSGRPHGHRLPDQHLRIPAADGLGVKEAFVIDVLHEHADLVRVPGKHQAHLGVRILHRNHVAVQIGRNAVGRVRKVIAHDFLHRLLKARRAGRFQDLLEEFERAGLHEIFLSENHRAA